MLSLGQAKLIIPIRHLNMYESRIEKELHKENKIWQL